MKRTARLVVGASAAALATVALAAPAHAQATSEQAGAAQATPEANAAVGGGVEDIVVTARKVAENLQDVPVAVTAFTGAALEAKSAIRVSDVIAFTPGFTARQAPGNATALLLSLRGQVQTDILATLEPSIGTYNDELYWGRAYGLNANLVDVANVQILKGPQGTLFGRNTTGGALLVTTNDPNFDGVSGSAAVTYGRFNEAVGELVLNLPVSEAVALRGAVRVSRRDGYAYGVRLVNPNTGLADNTNNASSVFRRTGEHFGGRDELQGRLKGLVRISDATELLLSREWYDYKSDGPARFGVYKVQANNGATAGGDNAAFSTPINRYIDYLAANKNAVALDGQDCTYGVSQPAINCGDTLRDAADMYTKVDTETYLAKLTSDVGFGDAKFIAGYRRVNADNNVDLDGTAVVLHTTTLKQDLRQWSAEGQLTGKLIDNRLDFVVGATYFKEDGTDFSYSLSGGVSNTAAVVGTPVTVRGAVPAFIGGNVAPNAVRNFADIDNESIGGYGQATFALTDKLNITGGLRYSRDKKGITLGTALANLGGGVVSCAPAGQPVVTGATPANDCRAFKTKTFTALSWTGGADYHLNEDVLLYAKASRGYRSGGQNLRALTELQFVPFDSEFVYEQEAGLKADLFDRKARFNIAAYRNIIKGAQRAVITSAGNPAVNTTLITNPGKVRNLGFEAELTVVPTDGLTLNGSASHNTAKYLRYVVDTTAGPVDLSDQRLAYLPKWQFSVSAQYTTDLTDAVTATFNVDYAWTAKQATTECTETGSTPCWPNALGNDANGRTPAQISADVVAATTLPASGALNARLTLGLQDDAYRIAFWGRNILNDRAFQQVNWLQASFRNYAAGLRREPVSYGITASARF